MARKKTSETYSGSVCKRGHSGLRYRSSGACVECGIEKRKMATRTPEDLARMRERSKEWYLRNKHIRPDQQKARRAADVPAYKEAQRKSYQKHRDKRLLQCKEYYEKNKEKSFARVAKRRAIKAGVGGSHTEKDVRRIFTQQKGCCAGCGEPLGKFHRDHIIPLASGGSNDAINIQLLCKPCNLRKGAKHPIEFMQSLGFLL